MSQSGQPDSGAVGPAESPADCPATSRGTVAVIGSGVAGLTAAYILQKTYDVTLIEADDRIGGHADTHDVLTPDGRWIKIDTGFIVHNRLTYPNLLRLFDELDVPTQATEMSMSIACPTCGLEFAGGRGLKGVLAQKKRLLSPRFLRLLVEVRSFHRDALDLLEQDPAEVDSISLGGFVALKGYSEYFVNHFLVPIVSCVWSTGAQLSMAYPARYLFEFLRHHQMLQVTGSPIWRTVEGGSRTYVERVVKSLSAVETSTPVESVRRYAGGVEITSTDGRTFHADRVVVATHPEQALGMLADPTDEERAVLGAMPYSRNSALLHTDSRMLPTVPDAKSSWNYVVPTCSGRTDSNAGVSYWMNRLHQIDEPVDYIVSLNSDEQIDPGTVLAARTYDHPIYTAEMLAAQRRLPGLSGGTTAFAGAYHGWGFHEDGCRSGVAAASAFGVTWE